MSTLPDGDNTAALKKYILPRNDEEHQRLDMQHAYLTVTVADGRLIYDKEVQLKPGSRVLDAGAGAGSWLCALSKEVPETVEIVGVDISSLMFPKSFPSNVHFTEASLTKLPESWTDSFDFVNQRLLVSALPASDWVISISEIFRVLKPGGMVQFVEFSSPFPSGEGLKMTEALTRMFTAVLQKRGHLYNGSEEIPRIMQKVGFVDIRKDLRGAPIGSSWGEVGRIGAENFKLVFRAYGPIVMAEGGLGLFNSEDEVDELVDAAWKEWDDHAGLSYNFVVIIGRKPL